MSIGIRITLITILLVITVFIISNLVDNSEYINFIQYFQ